MNDGSLRCLLLRVGFLALGLGLLMGLQPDGTTGSTLGWLDWFSRSAFGSEAEAAHAMAALAADAPVAGAKTKEPAAVSAGTKDDKEAEEAIGRIKVKPFDNLDIRRLQSVEVMATGYTAGKESTGKSPGHPEYGITFSGVKVRKDDFSTIAADPKVFPLGTILYIPGYGFGVVADTGSAIKGNKIDLYFRTKQQVYREWGKRKVRVYVLRRGDGKVTEAMMNRLNSMTKAVPVDSKVEGKGNAKAAK